MDFFDNNNENNNNNPFFFPHHHDHPINHISIFNTPDPTTTTTTTDFADPLPFPFPYDFNIRGTDYTLNSSRHHHRQGQTVHQIAPPRAVKGAGTGGGGDGILETDSVHEIILGPGDRLLPYPDESTPTKEPPSQSQDDQNMTNSDPRLRIPKTTSGVDESVKDQDSLGQEDHNKVYVRGIGDDEIRLEDKSYRDGRKEGEGEGEERKRQRIEEDQEYLRRREDMAERQRREDEITEVVRPQEVVEKTIEKKKEKEKSATTKTETSKVEVTKEVPKETGTGKGKETETKAKSKSRVMMTRIKTRFMKTVTDLRK